MNKLLLFAKKRDLHPGNVLLSYPYCYVRDLGLCISESGSSDIKEIMGVMPYVAPELFKDGAYSKASDVYSFGILMWEISSEKKPFHEFIHDQLLALRIFNGLRPTITEDTPQFYRDLMQKCWHSDPTQRPTAKEISELTDMWRYFPTQEIKDQLANVEELRERHISTKKETQIQHPGAIYTSRIMPNITAGEQMCLR